MEQNHFNHDPLAPSKKRPRLSQSFRAESIEATTPTSMETASRHSNEEMVATSSLTGVVTAAGAAAMSSLGHQHSVQQQHQQQRVQPPSIEYIHPKAENGAILEIPTSSMALQAGSPNSMKCRVCGDSRAGQEAFGSNEITCADLAANV
ncbi:unnamed protein product [Caenorhabditis auriculariae]|uniref:Nuclear receptor domain-containing protein n=1 Tax=Caenorhabditis auriculariae TaxID=2777116 RepID=A0A8S1H994_9PELO|nr:unnamed protein product [Caenorhabditis auriculariae]